MNISEIKALLEMSREFNLKRLRAGGVEIEWTHEGSGAKRAEVVTAVASDDAATGDQAAAPDPLSEPEPTPEEMALWSSNAFPVKAKKQ